MCTMFLEMDALSVCTAMDSYRAVPYSVSSIVFDSMAMRNHAIELFSQIPESIVALKCAYKRKKHTILRFNISTQKQIYVYLCAVAAARDTCSVPIPFLPINSTALYFNTTHLFRTSILTSYNFSCAPSEPHLLGISLSE